MKKENRFMIFSIAVLVVLMMCICVWGIPLNEANISVKAHGTDVSGTFTGVWSPIKGKIGTFTAEEGWGFEGIINPDGGLWSGQLKNFPISPEDREISVFDLPAYYTGAVEENTLVDVTLK